MDTFVKSISKMLFINHILSILESQLSSQTLYFQKLKRVVLMLHMYRAKPLYIKSSMLSFTVSQLSLHFFRVETN